MLSVSFAQFCLACSYVFGGMKGKRMVVNENPLERINDSQLKKLARSCVIIVSSLQQAREVIRQFDVALAEYQKTIIIKQMGDVCENEKQRDIMEYLLYALGDFETINEMAELAEDPAEIIIAHKVPRPPKRIGPVNKVNYAANRPPRVARSNCRIIKR